MIELGLGLAHCILDCTYRFRYGSFVEDLEVLVVLEVVVQDAFELGGHGVLGFDFLLGDVEAALENLLEEVLRRFGVILDQLQDLLVLLARQVPAPRLLVELRRTQLLQLLEQPDHVHVLVLRNTEDQVVVVVLLEMQDRRLRLGHLDDLLHDEVEEEGHVPLEQEVTVVLQH